MTTPDPESEEITDFSDILRTIGRQMRDRRKGLRLKKENVAPELRQHGVRVGKFSLDQYEAGTRNYNIKTLLALAKHYGSDLGIRRWFMANEEENYQWLLDDPVLSRAIARKLEEGVSQRDILKQLRQSLSEMD